MLGEQRSSSANSVVWLVNWKEVWSGNSCRYLLHIADSSSEKSPFLSHHTDIPFSVLTFFMARPISWEVIWWATSHSWAMQHSWNSYSNYQDEKGESIWHFLKLLSCLQLLNYIRNKRYSTNSHRQTVQKRHVFHHCWFLSACALRQQGAWDYRSGRTTGKKQLHLSFKGSKLFAKQQFCLHHFKYVTTELIHDSTERSVLPDLMLRYVHLFSTLHRCTTRSVELETSFWLRNFVSDGNFCFT